MITVFYLPKMPNKKSDNYTEEEKNQIAERLADLMLEYFQNNSSEDTSI